MAWGELKKEDLVKAGVDPDAISQLSTKINSAATKADVDELKTTLSTTQETLRKLEGTLTALATSRGEGGDNGGGDKKETPPANQPGPMKIDPLEFMEDPQGSVRKLINESVAPVTLHTLNVAAEMEYNLAKQRLPYFDRFEPEIKELWNKYAPAQKVKAGELIENLYNLVRGRHLDEIMTDTNKKEGKYNLVQSGGTSVVGRPGGVDSNRKPEDDLTEKEKSIAAQFGMTPAEWAAQKGGLKYV